MKRKIPAIYILANKVDGMLYMGATTDLIIGVNKHKEAIIPGFTQKYER